MFGLPDATRRAMCQVFALYPQIDKVLIYGSRAKGRYRPGSDIDLTLVGKKLNTSILSEVLVRLDELNTPYLMDVSLYDEILSVDLIKHIQRIGKVFYKKNGFISSMFKRMIAFCLARSETTWHPILGVQDAS